MRRMSPWLRSVFAPAVLALLAACSGCATTSDCEQRVSACLNRCEAATGDREIAARSLPPINTLTECESRCGCPETTTPPKPQGPPTPTGN
jgi:hypothetical protein